MSLSLIVVSLGAVVAVVGTGVLSARCVRDPRLYRLAWTLALFGLAVGLGAQVIGYLAGYSDPIFRAMELGAQVVAPLGVCLGLGEVLGRGVAARFAMRLLVSTIAIVVVVVLGTDPLNPSMTFSKAFPDPVRTYELVPLSLIGFVAGFTALTAIVAVVRALIRSARDSAGNDLRKPVIASAVSGLALAVPGLSWLGHHAGIALPLSARSVLALVSTVAAALIWFAATAAGRSGVGTARADTTENARDEGESADHEGGGVGGHHRNGRFGGFGPGDHDYRGGRYDERDYSNERRGRGYREDADPDSGGPGGSRQRFDDPDADLRYPELAALASEPYDRGGPDLPAPSGRYDDDGRYSANGQYANGQYANGQYANGQYGDDGRYGTNEQYGDDGRYGGGSGQNSQYGQADQYGRSDQYGEPGRYGNSDQYGEPAGYAGSDQYQEPGSYHGDRRGAVADPYGEQGWGQPADPYADNGWGGQAERNGTADPYSAYGRYGADTGSGSHAFGGTRAITDGRRADTDAAQLFGQIAIYTLIEERLHEFDQLTERLVVQVRAKEPNTLAYIVHGVPTAPMQRILYEVYRNRAAYDEHLGQPYLIRYEAERRPYVLATNIIELGLQQATVSPFPSISAISDILSESGIDLTGVTRSSRASAPPAADGRFRQEPRGLPGPPPAHRSDPAQFAEPGYDRPYQGWADLGGDDARYR